MVAEVQAQSPRSDDPPPGEVDSGVCIFIKGDSKFSARKASAKQVLAVFGKPGWQVVKESKFSPFGEELRNASLRGQC